MNDSVALALMGLLRFEIYGEPLSEKMVELIRSTDIQQLYNLALRHDLAHLAADALEKNRLLDENDPAAELLDTQKMMAFFRYKQLTYEFDCVCRILEAEKIRFLPLKGSVIRKLYPEEWMRVSCDVDILIDPENLDQAEQALKSALNYRRKGQCLHDISLYSPTDVHVELHFSLIEDERLPKAVPILNRIWEYASPVSESSYQMALAPEMLYFYHIAHMAKHIQTGGCGIRFFLDTQILNQALPLNSDLKNALLQEAGLLKFEEHVCRLSNVWFHDEDMDDESFRFHRFILDGGSYGTTASRLSTNTMSRNSSFFKYLTYRLFPPKHVIRNGYPVVKKHGWLLPLFYVIRPFHRLATGSRKRALQEVKVQSNRSNEALDSVEALFSTLELEFI